MSYEHAPATRLLATHCVACGRALVDAKSVEAGMGPDCRERHGYEDEGSEEQRAEMNRRVFALAVWRSAKRQLDAFGPKPPTSEEAMEHLKAIRAAGFVRLATLLEARLCDVVIKRVSASVLSLHVNYDDRLAHALRMMRLRFDGHSKSWLFEDTKERRVEVFHALCARFPGALGVGTKGVFTLTRAPRS